MSKECVEKSARLLQPHIYREGTGALFRMAVGFVMMCAAHYKQHDYDYLGILGGVIFTAEFSRLLTAFSNAAAVAALYDPQQAVFLLERLAERHGFKGKLPLREAHEKPVSVI